MELVEASNILILEDGCERCLDSDGLAFYPISGLSPHAHGIDEQGNLVYEEFHGEVEGFEPDEKNPGLGTWYCLTQGCPNSLARKRNEELDMKVKQTRIIPKIKQKCDVKKLDPKTFAKHMGAEQVSDHRFKWLIGFCPWLVPKK